MSDDICGQSDASCQSLESGKNRANADPEADPGKDRASVEAPDKPGKKRAKSRRSFLPPEPRPSRPLRALPVPGAVVSPEASPRVRLPAQIRALTGGGDDIAAFLVDVMAGAVSGATIKDRLDAARVLLDRGFGRVQEVTEADRPGASTLGNLSSLQLETVARRLLESTRPATEPATDGPPQPENPSDSRSLEAPE